jgi:cyanate lyase
LREEEFALMYCMKGGITYGEINTMLGVDREWHLSRLYKQLKLEEEEAKKATNRIKSKSRRR